MKPPSGPSSCSSRASPRSAQGSDRPPRPRRISPCSSRRSTARPRINPRRSIPSSISAWGILRLRPYRIIVILIIVEYIFQNKNITAISINALHQRRKDCDPCGRVPSFPRSPMGLLMNRIPTLPHRFLCLAADGSICPGLGAWLAAGRRAGAGGLRQHAGRRNKTRCCRSAVFLRPRRQTLCRYRT